MYRQLTASGQAGRQGSALMITLILSLAMASVVMYAVSDTSNAVKSSQREDNYARALAAAEYGAELAVAEIGKGLKLSGNKDTSLVLGDFVVGENHGAETLYRTDSKQAVEQRRIQGQFDRQEFRVQVRSARQVYNNTGDSLSRELVSRGWLNVPENASIPIGELEAWQFRDIYEVTASAQDARLSDGVRLSAEYQTRPVVQAVVKFSYDSPLDDLLTKVGVVHQEDAARLQVAGGYNAQIDWDNLLAPKYMYFGTNDFKPVEYNRTFLEAPTTKPVYNLAVSGEDHNIVKYFINNITSNRILTPWKLSTNEQQFFGAIGWWWSAGYLTLNYRNVENRESEDNTFNTVTDTKGKLVRATSANPYRPYSYIVGSSDADRNMWALDPGRTFDSYLLGGKNNGTYPWSSGAKATGLTVTVDEEATGANGVKGRILETKIEMYQSNPAKYKSPSKGGAFKIVLGAFEDLRNLYINIVENATSGSPQNVPAKPNPYQIYVGQYTDAKANSSAIIQGSVPLYSGDKIRPQTIHTIRNSNNQILVRLYEREELGKKVYYKYPAPAGSINTGEYTVTTPKLTSSTRSATINYPTDEALAVLDNLIATGQTTSVTPEMLTATAVNSSIVWVKDNAGNWYYGGNAHSYEPLKQSDRTYWVRYVPATKSIVYLDSNKKEQSITKSLNTKHYYYNITITADTVNLPAATWTGCYVWAYGGFHPLNGGGEFKVGNDGYKVVFDGESSKSKSSFVLYGSTNPDLDMLVKPDRESGETDASYNAKLAEYESKKALYSKRLEGITAMAVGRPFLWQELMGYSLGKRSDNHEPDVISRNDGLGTSGNARDLRTFFRKVDGQRIVTGFDETYQSIDSATLKHVVHPLAGKFGDQLGEVSPGYIRDRHDAIRVFEPTGVTWDKAALREYLKPIDSSNTAVKSYYKMEDFLYEVDFGVDALGEPIKRDAVNVMVGYEDNINNADYDYCDMMFTIYIAPEVKRQAKGLDIVSKSALQWWERDEREGLTGLVAHTPVTVNDQFSLTDIQDGDDATATSAPSLSILAGNYARLGWSEKLVGDEKSALNTQFWSMRDPAGAAYTTFPRAKFEFKDGFSNGLLDTSTKEARAWIEACDTHNISPIPFYFTDDDILDYVQWVLVDDATWQDVGVRLGFFDPETGKLVKENVSKKIVEDNKGDGTRLFDLQYIDFRWGKEDEQYPEGSPERTARMKVRTEMSAGIPSSLAVTKDQVLVRQIAAQVVGSETLNVLGIQTKDYQAIDSAQPEVVSRAFLAGEPRLVYDSDRLENGNYQYSGSEQSAVIEPRQDMMEFTDLDANGEHRQARIMQFLATGADTSAVVAKMYTDYFADSEYKNSNDAFRTLADRALMWEKFGMKDKRFVIGYHRGGNNPKFKENTPRASESTYLQDRYEVVSLGQLGWNPFRSTADGEKFLANNLQPKASQAMADLYSYEFKYGSGTSGVPQFVFDQPIDGAGALVVNGDLVVKDTLAYHGVLVVLGDVIIEPTLKKNQFLWSTDGWPLDRLGNSCHPVDPNLGYAAYEDPGFDQDGNWGYYPAGQTELSTTVIGTDGNPSIVDDPKSKYYNKAEPVRPLRRDEYRGELIVQGQLIVKGRIITKEVTDEKTGQVHRGVLNAYWSSDAIKSTAGVWALGENMVQRISWSHNDGINVDPVWQDRLDTPADLSGKGK